MNAAEWSLRLPGLPALGPTYAAPPPTAPDFPCPQAAKASGTLTSPEVAGVNCAVRPAAITSDAARGSL